MQLSGAVGEEKTRMQQLEETKSDEMIPQIVVQKIDEMPSQPTIEWTKNENSSPIQPTKMSVYKGKIIKMRNEDISSQQRNEWEMVDLLSIELKTSSSEKEQVRDKVRETFQNNPKYLEFEKVQLLSSFKTVGDCEREKLLF